MYGLRMSPKLWQIHLGRVLQQQGLRQCKADRCFYTTSGLGVLVYVDDLLLVGEATKIADFITTLKATFTLKHVTTLSRTQDGRFWGRDDNYMKTIQSASLWNHPTTRTCCVPTT